MDAFSPPLGKNRGARLLGRVLKRTLSFVRKGPVSGVPVCRGGQASPTGENCHFTVFSAEATLSLRCLSLAALPGYKPPEVLGAEPTCRRGLLAGGGRVWLSGSALTLGRLHSSLGAQQPAS